MFLWGIVWEILRFHGQCKRNRGESQKIEALKMVQLPSNQKETQSLNGKVATLSIFISKAIDKCIHLFDSLKKEESLCGQWNVKLHSGSFWSTSSRYQFCRNLSVEKIYTYIV